MNYSTLADHKFQFDLRPVRNIIVKQITPAEDDSSVYEIFNRLNTGGVNLKPQEIRTSMYHSKFYDSLLETNLNSTWRSLLRMPIPDLHMKDIEILLRASAMLVMGDSYTPSMAKFLNRFSKQAKKLSAEKISEIKTAFAQFFELYANCPTDTFMNQSKTKFSIPLFEAIFRVQGRKLLDGEAVEPNYEGVRSVMNDTQFLIASSFSTSDTSNVKRRYQVAASFL